MVEGPQVVENVHSEDELVALNALELAEMLPLEMLPVDSRAHRTQEAETESLSIRKGRYVTGYSAFAV